MQTILGVQPLFKASSQVMRDKIQAPEMRSSALVGTWKNVDQTTKDLAEIVITASEAGITVMAYGSCVSERCSWGAVEGTEYAAKVTGDTAVGFSAIYNLGFSQVILTGHLQGTKLMVHAFTEFTDGSERAAYYFSNTMKK